MQSDSLFGYLAARLSTHPENLATEALNYILNQSLTAKHAFLRYLRQANVDLPSIVVFQTQVSGDDLAVPDLVGLDEAGRQVLIVEAKFWAGLTDHQPLTYLRRLQEHRDGMLLFLAPAQRFPTLWNELLQRCRTDGFPSGGRQRNSADYLWIEATHRHVLALASWRSILAFMLHAVETEGHPAIASDIMQLQGLCHRMDDDAFLPLRSEDLTGDLGGRVRQFCQLTDEVTAMAVAEGLVSVANLRAAAGFGWYGRYMTIYGNGCLLHFSALKWSRYRATPLWLRVTDSNWKTTPAVKTALAPLELEEPPRMLQLDEGFVVPFHLPLNAEKAQVVDALLVQLREVAELLRFDQQ